MSTHSFYFGSTMPWMVIQGGKKPREFNQHTKTKTDLKKPQTNQTTMQKTKQKKNWEKVAGIFWQVYAWAVVPFRKTYQHLSEWKGISANIHPYGSKGWRRNKLQEIFPAMVTTVVSYKVRICIFTWIVHSLNACCSGWEFQTTFHSWLIFCKVSKLKKA